MTDKSTLDRDIRAERPNYVWLQALAISVAFVIGLLLKPDLAVPLLLGLCVSYFLVWVAATSNNPVILSDNYTSETSSDPDQVREAIVEAVQHPVFIIDERAIVQSVNSASIANFSSVKVGDSIFLRFRQPDIKKTIEEALATSRSHSVEYSEPIPDDRWFTMEIAPIDVNEDQSQRNRKLFLLGFHEETEAKRTDQMRSDFIANASHELRTPLASLLGYLETLRGPAKGDAKAQRRFMDTMLEQAERMSRLVNDLLSLSRIEMKSHVRPETQANLTEVIGLVVNSLDQIAERIGVEIVVEDAPAYFVQGDHDELVQVFENLIENACKYGEDGERVEVKFAIEPATATVPESVTVSVRDFGQGIAEEHINRITERFYRVDVARSREKQGTGLGLAIVKHILQRHGTKLKVTSEYGEGSEFSVAFPVTKTKKSKKRK